MSAQELNNEIIDIWGNATGNDEFFNELGEAELRIQSQHRHKGRKSKAEELTILKETAEAFRRPRDQLIEQEQQPTFIYNQNMAQALQSRFQSWQAGQRQPLASKQQATIEKMKAGAARKRGLLEQAFNDTQLTALTEILDEKKFKHRDIKFNKELRTLLSAQAYIGSRKSMAGWRVRNVDPDGPE
ncbi:MAG: hypothetical protein EZS28_012391 [Streblomastix strix]|uniref:Uncharacterized protein n=1 Tax=Streblomastix strix TaxID=222440 RepID=A0A5J4WBZ6_9EUKA|nr:MAG: hypothetical protein EZS28_012391 [Streblomastix strix]